MSKAVFKSLPPCFPILLDRWLDGRIAACSLSAQGLWLRMLMIMNDRQPRGTLNVNGNPLTDEQLLRWCFALTEEGHAALAELRTAGIVRTNEQGIIYSRQMMEVERIRRSARPEISSRIRHEVFAKHNWRCVYCGSTERLELDHIVAHSLGGSSHKSNLQPLCRTCNRRKGAGPGLRRGRQR